MMTNLIFIGLPASGKTTYAKALAALLGRPFFDTDALLEEKVGMRCGAFYRAVGKEAFRQAEHEVLQELTERRGAVIAVGGGAPTFLPSHALLKDLGLCIYIKAALPVIKERLDQRDSAAYLEGMTLQELFLKRDGCYASLANLVLDEEHTH